MAKKLVYNYTFTPGGAGAGTLVMKGNWRERSIQLITNVTDNIIIYNFASSGTGGTSAYDAATGETTLTLDYDTSSMSADDELQIFVDEEFNEVSFAESFVDPVHKLRVSEPENLIDTDFEYGLQSSKWETLEVVNNIPSIYSLSPGVSIAEISRVAAVNNSDLITVTCGTVHDLSIGDPIEVRGLTSRTAEGKYLVTNVESSLVFSYRANSPQSATQDINTAYTTIIPGAFFAASDIVYNVNESIATDNANPSTLTITTDYQHGLSTSTSLYITNTVGKKSFGITTTTDLAADGVGVVTTSNSSIFIPAHNLYNNQRIFLSADGGGTLPSTTAGAPEPSDTTTINAVYTAAKSGLDSIQTSMGSDKSRFLMYYTSTALYPYYVSYNTTTASSVDGGDTHYQYLTYGDYGNNQTHTFQLYTNTGYYAGYNWYGMYGEGADTLYTGNPVDVGSYWSRSGYNTSSSVNLANKGFMLQSTPMQHLQYTPYFLTVWQFPDPGTMGNTSFNRCYYYSNTYQTKYPNVTTTYYSQMQNTRQSAGGGWYYTYAANYYIPQTNAWMGYIKLHIQLENDNWGGQYWTGNSNFYQLYYGGRYTLDFAQTQQKGSHYRIECLIPVDDDATWTSYGQSGSVLTFAQMASTVVNSIISAVSFPSFTNPTSGINTAFAKVVDANRIQLINNTVGGTQYEFTNQGTAPITIETDQTAGVADDYYVATGVTSTTVSIASSTQVAPRVLEFDNATGIATHNSIPYLYIDGGHGLVSGQKVVYETVTGNAPSGLVNGTTYFAIVADDQYVGLATDVTNWQSGITAITDPAASATPSTYKLNIYSIAGRVAAAGTIGISTDTTNIVTGVDTKFTTLYRPGDQFVIKGPGTPSSYISNTIDTISNDNKLTLLTAPGITTSAANHFVDTKLNVRADGTFIHRPFDGGVEITAGHSPDSTIVRQTRKYFRYQSGKGIQCSVAINFNPARPVRLTEGVGTAVTMTTEYPHGLGIGNTVTISGASDSNYNGTYNVTAASDFTFNYVAGGTVSEYNPTGFIEYAIDGYENAGVRCGLFDFQNGFFYEYNGSELFAVRRSSVQQVSGTASVNKNVNIVAGTDSRYQDQLSAGDMIVIRGQSYKVTAVPGQDEIHIQPKYRGVSQTGVMITKTIDTRVPQSQWNLDKADGTGPSAFNLDMSKIQMAYFDYSWYGAGKIRFGFKDTNGRVRYCHEFIHNNRINEAYMRTGNIAGRYEVFNQQVPTYVPSLFHWGTSVIMDGRYDADDSYLFTASGNSITFTNGQVESATTNSTTSLYRQRVYGSYSNYYLRLSFPTSDAAKFNSGIGLWTADGELNGQVVDFTGYGSGVFYVYIYLSSGYSFPAIYPNVPNATAVSIGGESAGVSDVDLNSLIPLISIRLAPSVDNGLTGSVGQRDIINRMQLKMRELGISCSHNSIITVVLNGNLSNRTYQGVGSPSLSQYVAHASGDTIDGGTIIYKFRASGGTVDSNGKFLQESSTFSLEGLSDLGNSILGGDDVFPNGPDIMTICSTVVDSSEVTASASYSVSSRISWSESQA